MVEKAFGRSRLEDCGNGFLGLSPILKLRSFYRFEHTAFTSSILPPTSNLQQPQAYPHSQYKNLCSVPMLYASCPSPYALGQCRIICRFGLPPPLVAATGINGTFISQGAGCSVVLGFCKSPTFNDFFQ